MIKSQGILEDIELSEVKLNRFFARGLSDAYKIALNTNWPRGNFKGVYERSVVYSVGENGYIGFHLRKKGIWLVHGEVINGLFDYGKSIAEFIEEKRQICDTAGFIAMDITGLSELVRNGNFDKNNLSKGIGIDNRYTIDLI